MKNKTNESCFKIFNLLKLLYDDEADYDRVLELFKEDITSDHSRSHAHVVINKYMNALKVFGIKIEKEDNCFKIKNDLYTMEFTTSDIKAISILIDALKTFPDEEIKKDVSKIINSLKMRMCIEDKVALDKYSGKHDFTFYYSSLKKQIKYCQKLCIENYIFEIIYLNRQGEQVHLKKCKPIELVYNANCAFFKIFDPSQNTKLNIPITDILTIIKTPQKSKLTNIPITVVYILKGRLARAYNLKNNEYSNGLDSKGNLMVVNKDEPINVLLPRLMRYMDLCEIKTPKSVREEMAKLINSTLGNYK